MRSGKSFSVAIQTCIALQCGAFVACASEDLIYRVRQMISQYTDKKLIVSKDPENELYILTFESECCNFDSKKINLSFIRLHHPELTLSESVEFLAHCTTRGILDIDCFGDGTLIFESWKKSKEVSK